MPTGPDFAGALSAFSLKLECGPVLVFVLPRVLRVGPRWVKSFFCVKCGPFSGLSHRTLVEGEFRFLHFRNCLIFFSPPP